MSVLCQCGLACVMQEGRNLRAPCALLRSARDQCRLPQSSAVCCGDSPSLCFDVWSRLRFAALHHNHKNVHSKTKPRDESSPWNSLRTQTRRQNPNITCFYQTEALEIKCLLSKTIIKFTLWQKQCFETVKRMADYGAEEKKDEFGNLQGEHNHIINTVYTLLSCT